MAWGLAGCSRKLPALLSLFDGRPSSRSGHPSSPTTSTLVCRLTVWLGVPPCERTSSNASARVMQARRPVKATVLLSAELSNSIGFITSIVALRRSDQIAISMDGRGSWRDNVFLERFWRSVKYEEVYLRAYDSVDEARASLSRYIHFYNGHRPHSSLDGRTPDRAYFNSLPFRAAA